eukprot:GAFH01001646.1.p1 GENE.GAFH01001646.1~~GAFH01001646.1.p1  ORF type:complete len:344 (-),score=93.80 GAFH01001646.1:129-1160(-)
MKFRQKRPTGTAQANVQSTQRHMSYKAMKLCEDSEAWVNYQWIQPPNPILSPSFDGLLAHSQRARTIPMQLPTPLQYLNDLVSFPLSSQGQQLVARAPPPGTHAEGEGEQAGKDKPGTPTPATLYLTPEQMQYPDLMPTLSRLTLRSMSPLQHITLLMMRAHVIRFKQVVALTGAPEKVVLQCLITTCRLVQGCWVEKSAPRWHDRQAICRDLLLFSFAQNNRYVKRWDLFSATGLHPEVILRMLGEVAVQRPGLGWEFKLPRDTEFLQAYPQVAADQEREWVQVATPLIAHIQQVRDRHIKLIAADGGTGPAQYAPAVQQQQEQQTQPDAPDAGAAPTQLDG